MRRKQLSLIALLISLLFILNSCAVPATDLMAGVKAAEWPATPAPPAISFTDAVAGFSWAMLQESVKNPGNILISPASIYLALAMTLNGSDTTTRTAMLKALSAENLKVSDLNANCRDWMTLMAKSNKKISLDVANSIWYRTGFSADKTFLQTNANFFKAGAKVLDFNKPQAVETINNWVKENTKGTIEKILERIDPAVVMYLINTIYFKSDWQNQFELRYTADNIFAATDGNVTAKFMHRTGEMGYLAKDGAEGVLMAYADPQYAFFAILPPSGQSPQRWIADGSAAMLNNLFEQVQTKNVEIYLPRFETKYEDSLINELDKLGMGIAFRGGEADFSLMQTNRAKDLFISEVKHKTFCKINEVGTEAAAATLVEISKTSVLTGDVKLTFNRPFVYGILDTLTGLPIFIGVMENPVK